MKPAIPAVVLALTLSALTVQAADSISGASRRTAKSAAVIPKNIDAVTSASVVPQALRQSVKPNRFSLRPGVKRVLFVVGDPRSESVEWDLVNTAMKHFMDKGYDVELRDLYAIGFNPILTRENFYQAKDGFGKTPADITEEMMYVRSANFIVFCYPNWHDTPNTIVKGYMERVFQKKFAYRDAQNGLEGLLKGKGIFTIMNAGWVGMGRGDLGDGLPRAAGEKSNPIWDKYMTAFKTLDDDTAAFWGAKNLGRFVNDQTPGNLEEDYAAKLEQLRSDLRRHLDSKFSLKP